MVSDTDSASNKLLSKVKRLQHYEQQNYKMTNKKRF